MAVVTMKQLLETGVHFGHRTQRWNPKMKPYIFTERNGIHIVDLQQTLVALDETYDLVRNAIAEGSSLLFLGTKRQAQANIEQQALRCGMPYVNQRWLGGTLTNWRTIRQRIDDLLNLEERRDRGEFELLKKKEALGLTRKIEKLNHRLGGIKKMQDPPDLLFIVDVRRDATAVHEANILGIPIIALVDTNCDPDLIDHIIPSNDDAIRAIKLITSSIAEAAIEGNQVHAEKKAAEEEEEAKQKAAESEAAAKAEAEQKGEAVEEETGSDAVAPAAQATAAAEPDAEAKA